MRPTNAPEYNGISAALFDVDGTLIRGSSGLVATWFMFRRGMIGLRYVFLGLWYGVLHGLGLVDYERI